MPNNCPNLCHAWAAHVNGRSVKIGVVHDDRHQLFEHCDGLGDDPIVWLALDDLSFRRGEGWVFISLGPGEENDQEEKDDVANPESVAQGLRAARRGQAQGQNNWFCKVISMPYAPHSKTCFLAPRKFFPDRGENGEFDSRHVNTFPTGAAAGWELSHRLHSVQSHEVRLTSIEGSHPSKRCLPALVSLHFPGKSPLTAFNEIVKQIVTCNNLDGVATAPQDCFRRVRRFNPNFKDGMVLDKYQSQVVDMMAHAPGGVTIVEGCPGAGKTHLITEITNISAHANQGLILAASPSNENADSLTKKLLQRLRPTRRVVRLYSPGAEKQLGRYAPRDEIVNTTNRKPIAAELINGSELQQILRRSFDEHHQQKFTRITDKRVSDTEGSATIHLLKCIGYMEDENLTMRGAD